MYPDSSIAQKVTMGETKAKYLQKKQVDLYVRFWQGSKIKSRYWTSEFLEHSTAKDLQTCLTDATVPFGTKNIVHLGMDGPKVNWALLKLLQDEVQKNYRVKLLETGSCSLHICHNSVK